MGLVHLPRVLFLDEPSTGLDPQNRANLQEQVRRLHEETGSTIVLTTHYLEEADALAGRVIVVDHGLVIADDTAARLKSGLGDLVTLAFDRADHAVVAAERAAARFDHTAYVDRDGDVVTVRATGASELAPELVTDLASAGTPVRRIEVARPTLDDVFLNLTGRSLRETAGEAAPADSTEENDSETEEVAA